MLASALACFCGLDMIDRNGVRMCDNCDTVQERQTRCEDCDKPGECQSENGDRKTTPHDHRFELAWKRKIREYYPGQAARGI